MKFKIISFPILIVLIISIFKYSNARLIKKKTRSTDNTFKRIDGLVFRQLWPRAGCLSIEKKSPNNKCILPAHNDWTIHGLWPSSFYCTASSKFNLTALETIEDELKYKWISLKNNYKYYDFWKYEWNKHGSCGTSHEKLNSLFKYFKKALDLSYEYDIKNILSRVNILPGNNYKAEDIINGINQITGKYPEVKCFLDTNNNKSYLHEVSICFNEESMELINCGNIGKDSLTNCKSDMDVTYL